MSQKTYLVLTAVGPDRPGLVKEISTELNRAGANLEDSRMAILGGEFAVLMLVSGAGDVAERLRPGLGALESRSALRVVLKPTNRPTEPSDHLGYRLRVSGVDRPGIVERATSLLADHNINVAALESRLSYAPLSGTPMFLLDAELQVPSGTALSRLRADVNALADQENWDIVLSSDGGR